jgi:hypothetical protein
MTWVCRLIPFASHQGEGKAKPRLAIHAGQSFAPDFQLKGETAKRRVSALDLKLRR